MREAHPWRPPTVAEKLQLCYGDLGPYGHVNNIVYLNFFESVYVTYWRALSGGEVFALALRKGR
jgi:acyl-CoA thioesterase FadM